MESKRLPRSHLHTASLQSPYMATKLRLDSIASSSLEDGANALPLLAASSLDPKSSYLTKPPLCLRLRPGLSFNKSHFMIVNKLSTIRDAGNSIAMSEDWMVEHGNHESLIATHDSSWWRKGTETATDPRTIGDRFGNLAAGQKDSMRHLVVKFLHTEYLRRRSPNLVSCGPGASLHLSSDCLFRQVILIFKFVLVLNEPESVLADMALLLLFVTLVAGYLLSYFPLGYSTNSITQQLNYEYGKPIFQDLFIRTYNFSIDQRTAQIPWPAERNLLNQSSS
ncbi:hypothetical protein N8I77_006255 [Diaporthe amygdali]|uniref:Uncharacterized protein n=1 Tax=Phomopsis amygdali TaxID=1214568 RepID=A0AAD9SGL9_PHOAM|nr:hypothetical protein N8I77_006255 [Diaporthe amygdali]